jgi:hypothetical protein
LFVFKGLTAVSFRAFSRMRFFGPKAEFKRDFLTIADNSAKENIFLIFCLSASPGLRARAGPAVRRADPHAPLLSGGGVATRARR